MSIIFHVDAKRFDAEWQKRRVVNKVDVVEWFIKDKVMHMYICAENRTYHYSSAIESLSESAKSMLREDGEVLGIDTTDFKIEVNKKPEPRPLMVNDKGGVTFGR